MKITVLSDGAWATAIALLLLTNKHEVTLWGPFPSHIDELRKTRKNTRYLKGQPLPVDLTLSDTMTEAVSGAECIILAAPTQYARKSLEQLSRIGTDKGQVIVNVAKGIELGTHKRVSELCDDILGEIKYAVLSGPSHAEEVVNAMPTAVVVASTIPEIAHKIQTMFINDAFRVYTSDDVIGVELGGALKNVFAIAAGICDGMGLGDNSKAALITRGIAEMSRLGQRLGGRPETFSGLSGVGDMIVTCCSGHSRNRFVGEQLGKGISLDRIIEQMGTVVAEGIATAKSAYSLAQSIHADTPIIDEIYAGLYEGKDPCQGLRDLMSREAKSEFEC